MRRITAFAFSLTILTGCASLQDERENWTAEQFYNEAKLQAEKENYVEAIRLYEQLQGRYPYGRHAEQAQLEIAYAYYKNNEPAMALAACDRFIRQYPTHENVDYAYYLKGIINFRGERSIANWLLGDEEDLFDRDPKSLRDAYTAFKDVVDRFPNSRYAEDSRARMTYLYNAQAKYEARVAEYYYRRGAYVAAVNRAKYVIDNFPRTPSIEDALGISALAYREMGMTQLSDDAAKILARNFPATRYLAELQSLRGS